MVAAVIGVVQFCSSCCHGVCGGDTMSLNMLLVHTHTYIYIYEIYMHYILFTISLFVLFDDHYRFHQFINIGIEGKVLVRRRPCHRCPGCMACKKDEIMNKCKYDDICGKAVIVTLKKVSAAAIPLSRNQVQQKGVAISNAAKPSPLISHFLLFPRYSSFSYKILKKE